MESQNTQSVGLGSQPEGEKRFYIKDSEPPLTVSEIRERIAGKSLTLSTLARKEDSQEWAFIGTFPEFEDFAPPPEPWYVKLLLGVGLVVFLCVLFGGLYYLNDAGCCSCSEKEPPKPARSQAKPEPTPNPKPPAPAKKAPTSDHAVLGNLANPLHEGKLNDPRRKAERKQAATLSARQARVYHEALLNIARDGLKMTAHPNAAWCMPLLQKHQPDAERILQELEAINIGLAHKYGYLSLAAGHGVNCVVCLKSGAFDCKQMLRYLKRRSVNID